VNAIPIPHKLLKRTTEFMQCRQSPTPPLLSVVISPDPVVPGNTETFTASGTLDIDIPDGTDLIAFFGDPSSNKIIGDIYKAPICDNNGCPKAGIQFTKTLDYLDVPELPNQYDIVVGVVKKSDVLACAVAPNVTLTSVTFYKSS
ncbi:8005_t:CDS:1, partial [Scutellospora calospora]